jgi:hypothetical protein
MGNSAWGHGYKKGFEEGRKKGYSQGKSDYTGCLHIVAFMVGSIISVFALVVSVI